MNKKLEKILEPILLAGMVSFLGVMFLIFCIEHLLIRPPMRLLGLGEYKKKRRKK